MFSAIALHILLLGCPSGRGIFVPQTPQPVILVEVEGGLLTPETGVPVRVTFYNEGTKPLTLLWAGLPREENLLTGMTCERTPAGKSAWRSHRWHVTTDARIDCLWVDLENDAVEIIDEFETEVEPPAGFEFFTLPPDGERTFSAVLRSYVPQYVKDGREAYVPGRYVVQVSYESTGGDWSGTIVSEPIGFEILP